MTRQKGQTIIPPSSVTGGQRLMLDVYSALLRSRHWDNSVRIISYDEHGGFFDHVQPLPVETVGGRTLSVLPDQWNSRAGGGGISVRL